MKISEGTEFKIDIKTIISVIVVTSMFVGMYYSLQAQIEEAKELPKPSQNPTEQMIEIQKELVFISGFFEILFGFFLFFKKSRMFGCWGLILLLIAVFPANIYLYVSDIPRETLNISKISKYIKHLQK